MATMKDIAKLADVSISTVSKYLKKQIQVKEETAKRIDDAIKETNFVLNKTASFMKSGKSKTVGLILPHMKNLFFAELLDEIYRTLVDHNYTVLISYAYDQLENEKAAVQHFRSMNISGCIMVTEPKGDKSVDHINLLIDEGVKVVLVNRYTSSLDVSCYNANLEAAMDVVLDHLYKRKVSKIGYLLGWEDQNQSKIIKQKHLFTQTNYKKSVNENDLQYTDFKDDRIEELVSMFLDQGYEAIVCITELFAIKVKDILEKRSINVPNQMKIISLGNSLYSELSNITSIGFDMTGIGNDVALDLIAQIETNEKKRISKRKPFIITRETT